MKYNYQLLCDEIDKMPGWKHTIICAICLEKILPIIHSIGLPNTWVVVKKCLEFSWESTIKESNKSDGLQLLNELEATPEQECWDSDFLAHVVGKAVSFAFFALRAALSMSSSEQARHCIGLLLDFADPFDNVAKEFSVEALPNLAGVQLFAKEELSQQRLIEVLKQHHESSNQLREILDQEVTDISQGFEMLLPIYCYKFIKRAVQINHGISYRKKT